MGSKFRKKPVTIEAVQYNGINWLDITNFINFETDIRPFTDHLEILTLEGVMKAEPGDWIIKGIAGEFYPCKPDIFEKSYDEVSDGE